VNEEEGSFPYSYEMDAFNAVDCIFHPPVMTKKFAWIQFSGIPWDSQWPKSQGNTSLLRTRKIQSYQMDEGFRIFVDIKITYHTLWAFIRVTKAARS